MNHQSPKYSFYYLLSLVALIFTAISAGLILFGIIDDSFKDAWAFNAYRDSDGQYKFAISALLIAAPTYYLTVYLINQGLKKLELAIDSSLRRWLTYLILFVSALIILGVFIGIVNNFLSGALTISFMLKLFSVLLIAGIIFSYYFWDIKRSNFSQKTLVQRLYAIISIILLSIVFITAWFFVELPADARARRLDDSLMNNIYQLENAVNSYYAENERLPETLEELQADSRFTVNDYYLLDQENGKQIEYKKEGETDFSFCAEFRRANNDVDNSNHPYFNNDRKHEAGYSCVKGAVPGAINSLIQIKASGEMKIKPAKEINNDEVKEELKKEEVKEELNIKL